MKKATVRGLELFVVLLICAGLPRGLKAQVSARQEQPASRSDVHEFVLFEAGVFEMGDSETECGGSREGRSVRITRAFEVQSTEVTGGEWLEVMGELPQAWAERYLGTEDWRATPITFVSIQDAFDYANALSHEAGYPPCYSVEDSSHLCSGCERRVFRGFDCEGFRLPSEAEWEYAAAHGATRCSEGGRGTTLEGEAWTRENSQEQLHPVASLAPNPAGLYDTLGNAWEWTMDSYNALSAGSIVDPLEYPMELERPGFGFPTQVVVRGGSYQFEREIATPWYRGVSLPSSDTGFRIVRTVRQPKGY